MTGRMLAAGDALAPPRPWRAVGVATFAVAGFLLLSFGGAIAAAPVTLPLMYLASRNHPTRAFRTASAAIGGLTAAEVGWAATYLVAGDARPWIWIVPVAAAAFAVWLLGNAGTAPSAT